MSKMIQVPEKEFKELVSSVSEIKIALAGSKELGTKGIIHEVGILKTEQEKINNLKNKGMGWLSAMTVGASLITSGIYEYFKHKTA